MGLFGINEKNPEEVPFWRSLLPDIGESYDLAFEEAPCELFLDLRTFNPGEIAEVRVTLHGNGLPGVLWDIFTIKKATNPELGEVIQYLMVNNTPFSRGEILQLEAPAGPWKARFSYRQTLGMSRKVLFLAQKS